MSIERILTVLGNKATRPITDFAMQNTGLGDVYYVDYTNGDDGRAGKSPETAVKTLDYAMGLCTANQGDVIYLQAGHAETLATAGAIALDVAGVSVIGLGEGGDRPTFTFSAVDATMTISGASTILTNVVIVPSVDEVVSGIVVSAAGVSLDVEVQDTTDIEFVTAVLTTAGADNLDINMKYIGYSGGDACVAPIQLVGVDTARIYVDFFGVASTAIVNFITTACHNIDIEGKFYNIGTSLTKNVVDTVTGSTWAVRGWDGNSDANFSGGDNAAVASDDTSAIAAAVSTVDGIIEQAVSSATAVIVNADTLFTIAGGPIQVEALVSVCVSDNDATASTLQYSHNPTDGAATTFSGASASLANAAAGASVVLQGTTLSTAPLVNASGAGINASGGVSIILQPGVVTAVVGVGSTTGTWKHYIRYKPLSSGVTVS